VGFERNQVVKAEDELDEIIAAIEINAVNGNTNTFAKKAILKHYISRQELEEAIPPKRDGIGSCDDHYNQAITDLRAKLKKGKQ
jgi:hypothetical protein